MQLQVPWEVQQVPNVDNIAKEPVVNNKERAVGDKIAKLAPAAVDIKYLRKHNVVAIARFAAKVGEVAEKGKVVIEVKVDKDSEIHCQHEIRIQGQNLESVPEPEEK